MLSMSMVSTMLIALTQMASGNAPYSVLLSNEISEGANTSYYTFDARGALLHVDYLRDEAEVLARFPLDKFDAHVALTGHLVPSEDRVFVWVSRGMRRQPSDELYVWDYKTKVFVDTNICIDAGGDMNFLPIARNKFCLAYFDIYSKPGEEFDMKSQMHKHWYSGPDWHRSAEIGYSGFPFHTYVTYSPDGAHLYAMSKDGDNPELATIRTDNG